MVPSFHLSISKMVNKWEKKLSKYDSCELDIWPDLENLARDVISITTFGSSYEEGRMIFQLKKEQSHLAVQVSQSIYILVWGYASNISRNMKLNTITKVSHTLLHANFMVQKKKEIKLKYPLFFNWQTILARCMVKYYCTCWSNGQLMFG